MTAAVCKGAGLRSPGPLVRRLRHREGTVPQLSDPMGLSKAISRRRMLGQAVGVAALPLLGSLPPAHAAVQGDLRFIALRQGKSIGEHSIAFRTDGERLIVDTHIDLAVKFLIFDAFRLMHDAREIWQSGRLVSVVSTTERDGTRMRVSGSALGDGFRIVGNDGPFLAAAHLLTSNSFWDSRIVLEAKLIDVQYGGEVGLVVKRLGDEPVVTPQGSVPTSHHRIITPHYAGSVFYDRDRRWVKAPVEMKGEIIEYALAT